ncbi:MAG: putative bifunctional diguanylate cyclase/phosphodiesterase [Granulosicoccus sp.]
MKSFLTIRNSILMINLIVIGLILWLTISFLHLAVKQRRDTQQLRASVDTISLTFKANHALALERDSFDYHLNSFDAPAVTQKEQFIRAGRQSDNLLDKMTERFRLHISDARFFDHVPTTPAIIQRQLEDLDRHRNQLSVYRDYSISQYMIAPHERDRDMPALLFDSQTKTIADLVSMAKSLTYLPDTHASVIASYQELHNEILFVNVDLARKRIALNKVLVRDRESSPEDILEIAVLNQRIQQRYENIVKLAQASDNKSQLLPIALKAQRFYQQDYLWTERGISPLVVTQSDEIELTRWRSVMSNLYVFNEALAEATHASIELIANEYGSRAKRNLLIDIFLVFLCFAIAFASISINRRLKRYAYYDGLTKLANRMNLESTLRSTSAVSSRLQGVIFIDLDRFKSINDNYGHATGDALLIGIAARLRKVCAPGHLPARIGGDEFAVFVPDASSAAEIEAFASKLVAAITENIILNGHSLKVGASAGISISPHDCEFGLELLNNADIAMYHCKANKIEGAYRFNQEMAGNYRQRLEMELDLKKGLEKNEFHLVYQPKVCTRSGEVKGVEALLRWNHPQRGFVSPAQFIPVAEEIGLMGSIGQWVLKEACQEISSLRQSTNPLLKVAVNVSAQQFGDEHFIQQVGNALNEYGLDPQCLELEVTESLVMHDVVRVSAMLKQLKDTGVSVAIDDFGTGYSSLQYLQELPLDTLKIDRAFIVSLVDNDPTGSVANSIVQLAKLFDLETVAEGVETEDQDRKIRSLGVHHIQGYLYSKPVTADKLAAAIKDIEWRNGINNSRVA